jgi:Family of unknown function (DUF6527)
MKISWWQWLPFWRWRVVGQIESADEVPDRLPRNAVLLVGGSGHTKWIIFDCPCRTGHRIMLNADSNRRPFWTLKTVPRLTISPSVDYCGEDRRCHYFIRVGTIIWAKDSDR